MASQGRSGSAASMQSSLRSSTAPSTKSRQLSHLNAQLAQLSANLSDLENLLRMTSVQAESMRGLGGYTAALFMASSRVLGEESSNGATTAVSEDTTTTS